MQAALRGAPGIAVGNVVGSNIANILLVLGFAALVKPLKVSERVVRLDVPLMIGARETDTEPTAHLQVDFHDVVRHVRLQRPEVIITMWPGPGTHGQHQMAARAATIAFHFSVPW